MWILVLCIFEILFWRARETLVKQPPGPFHVTTSGVLNWLPLVFRVVVKLLLERVTGAAHFLVSARLSLQQRKWRTHRRNPILVFWKKTTNLKNSQQKACCRFNWLIDKILVFDLATKNTLFLSVFSGSHSLNTGMVTRHFHGAGIGMDDHTQNVQIGIAFCKHFAYIHHPSRCISRPS